MMASTGFLPAMIRRGRWVTNLEKCLGGGSGRGRRLHTINEVTLNESSFSSLSSPPAGGTTGGGGGVLLWSLFSNLSRRSMSSGGSGHIITCSSCSHSYSRNLEDFVNLVCCPKCGDLQKLGRSELPNYFQIFRQAKSYRVDLGRIANLTRQLQKVFHPDLYGGKGEDQQNLSQEYSSFINKALSTLTDPIERGRYLLALEGSPVDDPNNDQEKTTTKDPAFLEEMMQLNENLERLNSYEVWKEFRKTNDEELKRIHDKLATAFDLHDLEEAHHLLGRMKYYDTLQHKLKELKARMGIVE